MIAGAGFAQMAWKLAQQRTRPNSRGWPWPHRTAAAQCWNGPDAEYFRIIHNAAQATAAFRAARRLNMLGDAPTVTL